MWWFKKKEKNTELVPPILRERKSKIAIIIHSKTGETRSFARYFELGYSGIQAYYKFYRWFYLKESLYFTFHHKNGCEIFIRDQIKHIQIEKTEVWV